MILLAQPFKNASLPKPQPTCWHGSVNTATSPTPWWPASSCHDHHQHPEQQKHHQQSRSSSSSSNSNNNNNNHYQLCHHHPHHQYQHRWIHCHYLPKTSTRTTHHDLRCLRPALSTILLLPHLSASTTATCTTTCLAPHHRSPKTHCVQFDCTH